VATVEQKVVLGKLVEGSERLELVEVGSWAGLGGVRYIPSASPSPSATPDDIKHHLNKLNISLVERLRATDAAFSLGIHYQPQTIHALLQYNKQSLTQEMEVTG
jgi:hypothetical protein